MPTSSSIFAEASIKEHLLQFPSKQPIATTPTSTSGLNPSRIPLSFSSSRPPSLSSLCSSHNQLLLHLFGLGISLDYVILH